MKNVFLFMAWIVALFDHSIAAIFISFYAACTVFGETP